MDSPHLQSSSSHLHRMRTNSNNLSVYSSVDSRGAVRKRGQPQSRTRSVSTSQAERLHHLAVEHADIRPLPPTSLPPQWLTPQSSPQPQIFSEPTIESFPQWTVPTPPRSDSGIPSLSVDANEEAITTGISAPHDFRFEQHSTAADMSSLGFLLPSQYGSGNLQSEPSSYTMDPSYIPTTQMSQPPVTSGTIAYGQRVSSSPAMYQSRTVPNSNPDERRPSDSGSHHDSTYHQDYRQMNNSYDSLSNSDYSMAPNPTIPSISGLTQSPMPSPHMGSTSGASIMPQYNTSVSRSPNFYDSNLYGSSYPGPSPSSHMSTAGQSLSYPPPFTGSSVNEVLAKPLGDNSSIRVLNQRPKPQCWEHGCNGRQFSTFSNLLRHQREKSGTASKSYCPKCGAEFTRTTARNGHLAHDKCTKQRRQSEGS